MLPRRARASPSHAPATERPQTTWPSSAVGPAAPSLPAPCGAPTPWGSRESPAGGGRSQSYGAAGCAAGCRRRRRRLPRPPPLPFQHPRPPTLPPSRAPRPKLDPTAPCRRGWRRRRSWRCADLRATASSKARCIGGRGSCCQPCPRDSSGPRAGYRERRTPPRPPPHARAIEVAFLAGTPPRPAPPRIRPAGRPRTQILPPAACPRCPWHVVGGRGQEGRRRR